MLRSLLGFTFLLAVVGCTSQRVGAIDYRFTSGLGGVTASAHIEPDGKMTRLKLGGERDVTTVNAATLAEIQRLIEDAQLPTLKPIYKCERCSELPSHTISAQIQGVTYTVTVDDTADYPERLGLVIDKIGRMCDIGVPWD